MYTQHTHTHTHTHTHAIYYAYVYAKTGLQKLASTRVSGSVRTGLSRGQRKLLVVAIQLLKFPSVIFLDEPTSGKKRER